MIDMLKSMAIFAEVVNLGSFRAAAKSQGVSPSVISRHISLLEDRLGEVLLNRSTRKLALTSAGKEFVIHCDQMLQSASDAVTSIKENSDVGQLRITLPMTLVTTKFGHIIHAFRKNNQKVDFSFIFDDNNVDIIKEGFDIALRLGPLNNSTLKSKRITTIKRLIVCTPQYLASVGEIIQLTDINRCNWIGRKNPATLPILSSPNGDIHIIPEQAKFIQVNSVEAVKALVLSHNGLGLFSDMLVEQELLEGKLIRLLPQWQVKEMQLYAVWSAQKTTGRLVKRFVNFLSEELNDL